jgi:hypothetical protein
MHGSTHLVDIIEDKGDPDSQLIVLINSILSALDTDTDGYKSSSGHHPSWEVFMASSDDKVEKADDDNILATSITTQTPEAQWLKATRPTFHIRVHI